jgi:hypothetical protein
MLEYPLSPQSKGSIEHAKFAEINARQLKGGLPIFTVVRDVTINKPMQGETWLENISSSMFICSYISGTKYKTELK